MRFLLALCALTFLLAPGAAFAEEPLENAPAGDRPWAQGVSKADQAEAERLFAEGTDLLKDAFFTRAVELYRQALQHWDHPAIHFNLAKALMNLDDPASAYGHLKASMRFGGPPLDKDQIAQVEHYITYLYANDLAEVVISTEEAGAKVTMDGVELFTGPGKWQGVVRPEKTKAIIATKMGYQTVQIAPELEKGKINEIKIEMEIIDSVTLYEREFDQWIPWTVIGVGVALAAGGGVMTWQSSEAAAEYDSMVADCNAENPVDIVDDTGTVTPGAGRVGQCVPSSAINDKKDQGSLFETLSIVGYATGGAAIVTGLILLYVNRERPISVEQPSVEPVAITPVIGPDRFGVSASIGF